MSIDAIAIGSGEDMARPRPSRRERRSWRQRLREWWEKVRRRRTGAGGGKIG